MTDPMQTAGEQPSEEELRAYVEQLRGADPAELVAQAYSMLGAGAEVKLGRPDARTLIDAMHALVEGTQGRLPTELTDGMRNGVAQLQMAQVQVEKQVTAQQGGETGGPEAGRTGAGAPAAAGQAGAGGPGETQPGAPGTGAPAQPGGQQSMTDRLWIPGRDQPPPRSP